MREIVINSKRFEVVGEITKLPINPWTAKIAGGGLEYSSFQGVLIEEWHDFRSGIGRESALPEDTSRLWWLNGVDVTTPRGAVLNPLVTTASSFGVAPVKIIDFQGVTYAISASKIAWWNTTLSRWDDARYLIEDCEDAWDTYQNSNATHALDTSDYKIGSGCVKITVDSATVGEMLAIETVGSMGLTVCNAVKLWVKSQLAASAGDLQLHLCSGATWTSPTGEADAAWTNPEYAYDENTGTNASRQGQANDWSAYLYLEHSAINCDCARYHIPDIDVAFTLVDLDAYYGAAWHDVYQGAFTEGEWITKYIPEGTQSVTSFRIRFYNDSAGTPYCRVNELDFGEITTETIDLPELVADTWTEIEESITTPANLGTVTKVGLKSVVDLGAEPYIIRIDDVRGTYTSIPVSNAIDAIVATDTTDEYFVISSATAAIYSADGGSWLALTGCKGYLAWYENKLRSIDTDGTTLRSSAANNIDGSWTTMSLTGQFGTVYDLFEGKLLADGSSALYMCGTEGLYTIDVTTEIAYKQEVSYPPLTYSGHVGKYWNANVWVATGYGILKVSPSMATLIGPDQEDGLPSGYQGYIYDFETVNNWLVYCVNGGSPDKSSILKRNASVGGNIQVYTTSAVNKAIACLHHSPSSQYTNGRLWWGEGTDIKYCMFPDITSNVKQIATYQYAAASDAQGIILPRFRKLAAVKKVALNVSAVTKSCDTDEYITLYYDINETGSWTSMGTYKTSPKPTMLEFNSGLGTEFYLIQFAAKLQRGTTTTNSPELESLAFAWRGKPTRISSWTFRMICTAEEFTELEAIYDTATLVAFYPSGDTNQTSHNVAISMMPQRYAHESMGGREGIAEITVEEVYKG